MVVLSNDNDLLHTKLFQVSLNYHSIPTFGGYTDFIMFYEHIIY